MKEPATLSNLFFRVVTTNRKWYVRYGFALVVFVVSMALSKGLMRFGNHPILSLAIVSTLITSVYAGFGPGMVAAILTSIGIDYLYIEPIHSTFNHPEDFIRFFTLLIISFLCSWLVAQLCKLILDLESARIQERHAKEERQNILNLVAHDLRSPLSTISIGLEILQRDHEGMKDKEKDVISRLSRSTRQMDRMIQDLLDSAKIESGTFEVKPATVRVTDLVDAVDFVFRGLAERRGIRFETRIHGEDLSFRGDFDQILRALSNLVSNALKFTPKGGEVVVDIEKKKSEILLSASDTGPGIAPDDLPHVFERSWQVKKTAAQGTGLGLYIARGIVKAHGGMLSVDSIVGRGSRFEIHMPAQS